MLVRGEPVAAAAVPYGGSTIAMFGSLPAAASCSTARSAPPTLWRGCPREPEGQVRVVVLHGQPGGERAVEDRLPAVPAGLDRVGLQPARLRRPLVEPVRPGAREDRAEVAVEERVVPRRLVNEAELAAVVVAERELVVAAALARGSRRAAGRAPSSSRGRGRDGRTPCTARRPMPSVEAWRVPRARPRGSCSAASGRRPRSREASRSSGRTTGSPSSGARSGRSARCAGFGSGLKRRAWPGPPRPGSRRPTARPRPRLPRHTRCARGSPCATGPSRRRSGPEPWREDPNRTAGGDVSVLWPGPRR